MVLEHSIAVVVEIRTKIFKFSFRYETIFKFIEHICVEQFLIKIDRTIFSSIVYDQVQMIGKHTSQHIKVICLNDLIIQDFQYRTRCVVRITFS